DVNAGRGTVDSARSPGRSGRVDRRDALKKAAVAAGAVAWATPVVQIVSSGTALAQAVTGCFPVCTITLQATGANCACVPDAGPACCDPNTYLVQSLT